MSIYSGNFQIVGPLVSPTPVTSTTLMPIVDVLTKSTTGRACVLEACIQSTNGANSASNGMYFNISRSTNTPVQAGQTYLIPENQSDQQSLCSIATAWSVAPTVATSIRRYNWSANIAGQGALFVFTKGYSVSPTNSIVISVGGLTGSNNVWNTSVNAINGWFVVNE